jgi:hypothetical protein
LAAADTNEGPTTPFAASENRSDPPMAETVARSWRWHPD